MVSLTVDVEPELTDCPVVTKNTSQVQATEWLHYIEISSNDNIKW